MAGEPDPEPDNAAGSSRTVLAEPISALLPAVGERPIVSVCGPIGDYYNALRAEELPAISAAVPKRRREFATGRQFARTAMRALSIPAVAVPQGQDRAPQWPQAMRGSISHTDLLAWVVAAPSAALRGLGADIERLQRLKPELHDKLFTDVERAQLSAADADLATVLFCAKEAVYKATNPIAGAFIGFQEVEVVLGSDGTQFCMRYLGEHEPSAVMEQGSGYLTIQQGHAMALFLIPG